MKCRRCQNDVSSEYMFCPNCGEKIENNFPNNNIQEKNLNTIYNFNTIHDGNSSIESGQDELEVFNSNDFNVPNNTSTPNLGSFVENQYQNNYQMNSINNYSSDEKLNQNPKKTNKKTIAVYILIILIVLFNIGTKIFSIFAIIYQETNKPEIVDQINHQVLESELSNNFKGTRTIMVYIIGSNLESDNGSATQDIMEMVDSKFDSNSVNLLVYVGGTKKWYNSLFSTNENAIYQLNPTGTITKLKSLPKKSMTSVDTLTEFIDYGYSNFNSDLYDLILWDHGGGPVYGYGKDDFYPDNTMSISNMVNSLENSKYVKNKKLEMIGFDACLMASIEIGASLKNYANYLVASEESEPGSGWDYTFLSTIDKNTSSYSLGKHIVDYYYNYYEQNYETKTLPLTLSFTDLSYVNTVTSAIDESFSDFSGNLNIANFNTITQNSVRATNFGNVGFTSYDLLDLYDFIDDISENIKKASNLQNTIKRYVVYSKTNVKDSYGVTIYFPAKEKSVLPMIINEYSKTGFSKNYINFLNNYAKRLTGQKIVNSDIKSIIPNLSNGDNSNTLSTTLPEDLVNNYLRSFYQVVVKNNDNNGYHIVYNAGNTNLEKNILSAVALKKELVITDKNGENASWVTSQEYERTNDSVTYAVYAQLEYINAEELDKFKVKNFIFFVKFTNGSEVGEIINIRPLGSNLSEKVTVNLDEWTDIASISRGYIIDDENGNALDEWQSTEVITGYEYNLRTDGFSFRLKDFNEENEYYYIFSVEDTQGNIHRMKKISAK